MYLLKSRGGTLQVAKSLPPLMPPKEQKKLNGEISPLEITLITKKAYS